MSFLATSRFAPLARRLAFLISFAAVLVGCGNNQLVRQLQSENDRLLAEFRAEREQKLQLSEKLAATQARLAESEKLVARQNPLPSNRISRIEPAGPTSIGGQANSGLSNPSRNPSGSSAPSDLQWRPMTKSAQ